MRSVEQCVACFLFSGNLVCTTCDAFAWVPFGCFIVMTEGMHIGTACTAGSSSYTCACISFTWIPPSHCPDLHFDINIQFIPGSRSTYTEQSVYVHRIFGGFPAKNAVYIGIGVCL